MSRSPTVSDLLAEGELVGVAVRSEAEGEGEVVSVEDDHRITVEHGERAVGTYYGTGELTVAWDYYDTMRPDQAGYRYAAQRGLVDVPEWSHDRDDLGDTTAPYVRFRGTIVQTPGDDGYGCHMVVDDGESTLKVVGYEDLQPDSLYTTGLSLGDDVELFGNVVETDGRHGTLELDRYETPDGSDDSPDLSFGDAESVAATLSFHGPETDTALVNEAAQLLRQAGVSFDSGTHINHMNGETAAEWHLDFSLEGATLRPSNTGESDVLPFEHPDTDVRGGVGRHVSVVDLSDYADCGDVSGGGLCRWCGYDRARREAHTEAECVTIRCAVCEAALYEVEP